MLPIKSFWRVGSRSYSRLYNLCLTESEVKFVESQTKHILDNANLDRDSDQIVQEYVNTKLKDIHPDFTNRNAICPIKLEGMVKALEFYQLVPQDMALFCKQHQIGMVASLYFISQVEELAKENILQFSESQSISCATLEKWRERVREVLETCGFKEQGEKLKLQDLNKKSVTRSDLFELLCPDLKKEVRGKVEPSHPVDAIRILELQRSLNTPVHFDLTRFTSSLDWLVQINVCREILGDEKAAVFHLHEHVALPITFHFLRHLGLSEKLCKEALCTPLKIWPSKPPHAKSSRNPKTHLKKLRKIFDDPCHDLSLMCHMYPTLSKIPRDVLINGLEELSRKDLNNCSLPLKTELLKYVLFKNASFDGDKLSQINQKRNHVDCLFNYMVPTQTFEDLGEPNSTFEDSRYFLAAGLSDNAVRLRQNARNLCTLQQTRRAFSTSTCSKRIALTFDGEPNFTKWVRVQMYIVFLRNSFDYNFDKKDFLKGCEMVSLI